MRRIALQTWERRAHFNLFKDFDQPHFSMCANVDVTAFYPLVRECGHSFTVSVMYVLARAANAIPEFRYRIRGDQVVEHEVVHPSTTILAEDGLFSRTGLAEIIFRGVVPCGRDHALVVNEFLLLDLVPVAECASRGFSPSCA